MNKFKVLLATVVMGFMFSIASFADEVYVLKSGESIQNVLNVCNDTPTNRVTIYLEDGEYAPFSMVKPVNRERYVDIFGVNPKGAKVVSYSGKYEEPAAEIRTNGSIGNIVFINKADTTRTIVDPNGKSGYAVHADYGKMDVKFINCKMVSGQNVALGMGISYDSKVEIDSCELINETVTPVFNDDYYKLGSIYCHTDVNDIDKHTGALTIKNSTLVKPDNVPTRYTVQSLFGSTINVTEQ